mgnify:CR=1 FL=1
MGKKEFKIIISELSELRDSILALCSIIDKTGLYIEYKDQYIDINSTITSLIEEIKPDGNKTKYNYLQLREKLNKLYFTAPSILYTFKDWIPPGDFKSNGEWQYPGGYLDFEKQYKLVMNNFMKLREI